ncbi:MAG: APC family permease [Candidatus Kryptoniota bacterium]
MTQSEFEHPQTHPYLLRGLTLSGTVSLNMIDMIGVGPFITIPLIISAMGGPQAMVGWILGAVLALSDGMVWAELGAALPGSGGTYHYLGEIYGRGKLGKMMSFLFIWQLIFSAPLSIASGCLGLAEYSTYFIPKLTQTIFAVQFPFGENFHVNLTATGITLVAISVCVIALILLSRKITVINKLARFLWVVVMITIAWVIFAGVTHFKSSVAFNFPADAFSFSSSFFLGLGSAMLISVYDYWGYYNVCFLGDEVKEPSKTIPRAIIISITLVGIIYVIMNVSIIGVIPWQELVTGANENHFLISAMMEKLYGNWAGKLATFLIMWTAFSSIFSLLLGYSRIPFAAATDGNFFKIFARVHNENRFPYVSLLTLGSVAILFCFLSLVQVIAALVIIRITIQFLSQTVGLLIWRWKHPKAARPFKMWLYPLPAIISLIGFIFVLISRKNFFYEIKYAATILIAGLIIYFVRAYSKKEWPFIGT